jgi:superfamily I DNA/RNA helicase/mRNA-degrading endonuclease RelE of RelBE toxin-antitoxin system
MPFEIIHKPTFTNQLLAIPKERAMQVLEKIEVLRDDPKPHGNLKKKLKGYKGDIYRLRSGDFRIIYTYGDGWVALLGVDARKDVYRGDKEFDEPAPLDVTALTNLDDRLVPQVSPTYPPSTQTTQPDLLPVELTEDLLIRLLIPSALFPILLHCQTFDHLLAADIPDAVRDRLFDSITAPNFDQVLTQPSFVTGNTDDLLRFKEGDLLGFLLKLNPEQEKFVTWAANATGPTLLKGSPGTGKSTVALYRTQTLLKALQASGTPHPRILFTTYTNALVTFSEQLIQQLLGQDSQFVEVRTADAVMSALAAQASGKFSLISSTDLLKLVQQAIPNAIATLEGNVLQQQAQRTILQRLKPDYLLDELTEVIDARGIETLDEYSATPRAGRRVPLNKTQRQAIWSLKQQVDRLLAAQHLETWAQMRKRALQHLETSPHRYDAVIVDEAQDLSPVALRFLTQICRTPSRLFITADANQSIYGNSFRWGDIHTALKFAGRTGILKINHRTTQEIGEAAHAYLQEGILDEEMSDRTYIHSGPFPIVRAVHDRPAEGALLMQFCRAAAREFRLGLGACAILTPTEKAGRNLVGQLTYLGLEAEFMTSKDLKLTGNRVKVLPLKSAKGLEFPIVAIAGFLEATYPPIPKNTADEEKAEAFSRERRTLFVGMTRSMRALLLIVPATQPSPLLQNFDPKLWNLGTA